MRKNLINKATAIALVLTITFLTGCVGGGGDTSRAGNKTRFEGEFLTLFDTVTRIVAYTESRKQFDEYVEFFHSRLEIYHKMYNIYSDYEGISNIKKINDSAGGEPVAVDGKIIDLLLYSKEIYKLTNGQTNVAMGSVLSIWHDYREEGIDSPEAAELPPIEPLTNAAKHTNIDDVVINEVAGTVVLRDEKMRLDVGAIAKGYAVEQVCKEAQAAGISNVLVSVGGNVRAIGGKDGKPWSVGIEGAVADKKEIALPLEDSSLVTSGDYQRYYTVAGERYCHIIDPKTNFPPRNFSSVTVNCADSGLADGLSTALFTLPLEEGKALLKKLNEKQAVSAIWLLPEGEVVYS